MKNNFKTEDVKWDKGNGLLPAIIQDSTNKTVLMQGYFSKESLEQTQSTGKVCFYSRSKERLWTKGESSENYLIAKEILLDCDGDSFLVKAEPQGPTCHTGTDTCWGEKNEASLNFLNELEAIISDRKNNPTEKSYVARLFEKGINKIAQKVGEEAVEVVIEAKDNNDELFLNESADLLFHYLILLKEKGFELKDVVKILEGRK
jgi:phosphoribosyl-ATP pyrophosphohydrolase/phosphoribosyl-AMP cyclohydrolase